ncbi:hypothetical protein E2C01_087086 [Portunus trituberculatus]|uniref:Uncharacterized protein n=1 Tax=Portunus trituberculatus TaxID=210409 RepID=A0A5B7JGC8_PORTR|nr:hypothetical protein [Portunus trituberculatus]
MGAPPSPSPTPAPATLIATTPMKRISVYARGTEAGIGRQQWQSRIYGFGLRVRPIKPGEGVNTFTYLGVCQEV